MEWLESLLPLIIFAIYLLSRIGKSRREAEPPSPEAALNPAPPRAATPFEELIRQIQQAAEEAKQTAEQTVQPSKWLPPGAAPPAGRLEEGRSLESRSLEGQPLESQAPEFHEVGAFEHEQHGFAPDSPFSEVAFAHLARGADVTAHPPGHLDQGPHALRAAPAPSRRHALAERLRHPDTAHDAFVLREVLAPPRARRPR